MKARNIEIDAVLCEDNRTVAFHLYDSDVLLGIAWSELPEQVSPSRFDHRQAAVDFAAAVAREAGGPEPYYRWVAYDPDLTVAKDTPTVIRKSIARIAAHARA